MTIPKAARAGLKQLVLRRGADPPVLVDVSKSSPSPPKPVLNAADPVKIGTQVEVKISWKNAGEVKAVSHNTNAQTIVSSAKNSVLVRLADSLTRRPGKVVLSVDFKDGTKLPLPLQIVDQQIAIVDQ